MNSSFHQGDGLPIVLVTDNNPALRQVIAWTLYFGGFQPVEAANGLEALQWMERAAREQHYPSLILLDLTMPGMDGRAFLQWLDHSWVSYYPTPAVILCTASRSDEDLLNLSPLIKHIISKPFHAHDLLEAVRQWSP